MPVWQTGVAYPRAWFLGGPTQAGSKTHVDVGVVFDELGGDVGHTLVGQVLHVAVSLPVPVRAVGVRGGGRGVCHSGGRHHTH